MKFTFLLLIKRDHIQVTGTWGMFSPVPLSVFGEDRPSSARRESLQAESWSHVLYLGTGTCHRAWAGFTPKNVLFCSLLFFPYDDSL